MVDRVMGICLSLLSGAVAIYVAVRLIESVAEALLLIIAVVSGLVIAVGIVSLAWRRYRVNRW